jgi:hypothetical protein
MKSNMIDHYLFLLELIMPFHMQMREGRETYLRFDGFPMYQPDSSRSNSKDVTPLDYLHNNETNKPSSISYKIRNEIMHEISSNIIGV